MAEKTKDALKEQSSTTFYDNDLGGITPADHRQFNEDLIDSMATAAQGSKAETAIQAIRMMTTSGMSVLSGTNINFPTVVQAATVNGEAVPKSGVTLQFPAIPTAKEHVYCSYDNSTGASFGGDIQIGIVGGIAYLVGSVSTPVSASFPTIKLTNIPTDYTALLPGTCFIPVIRVDDDGTVEPTIATLSSGSGYLTIKLSSTAAIGAGKSLYINAVIPLK